MLYKTTFAKVEQEGKTFIALRDVKPRMTIKQLSDRFRAAAHHAGLAISIIPGSRYDVEGILITPKKR
jgi:hypothetical protein